MTWTDQPTGRSNFRRGAMIGGLALLVALGACSSDESTSDTTTAESTVAPEPTEGPDTTTAATTDDDTGVETLTLSDPAVDPWTASAQGLGVQAGSQYRFECPADGDTSATVWGSDPYTDDSAVCPAAVHAGVITAADGGPVTFRVETGSAQYAGSEANGVTTSDYGAWPAQFTFVD